MLIQPCLIVVDPVIVLAPDKVKVPEPFFTNVPSPDKFPENVTDEIENEDFLKKLHKIILDVILYLKLDAYIEWKVEVS